MNSVKYIMILVFFILGCVASGVIVQENNFEQRKKVAEQVRRYRQKSIEYKQGAFPERTVNPRMDRGFYLKPTPREEYYMRRGLHPNVGYRPMITWCQKAL